MKKTTFITTLFLLLSCTIFGMDLKESVAIIRHNDAKLDSMYNQLGLTLQENGFISAGKTLRNNQQGFGSGFVFLSNSGNTYIVTNQHVVENTNSISIQLKVEGKDKVFTNCRILYTHPQIDIALIETPKEVENKALKSYSMPIQDGQEVFSAGYPGVGNAPLWQLGKGVISNKEVNSGVLGNKDSLIIIQHTAQVDAGNSGGPLLAKTSTNDSIFYVVGVNTWKVRLRENTNFSIRLKEVEEVISMYENNKPVENTPFSELNETFTKAISEGYISVAPFISEDYILSLSKKEISYLLKNSRSEIYQVIREYDPIIGLKLMVANEICNQMGNDISFVESKLENDKQGNITYLVNKKKLQFTWKHTDKGWKVVSLKRADAKTTKKQKELVNTELKQYGIRKSKMSQRIEAGVSFPLQEEQSYGFSFGYSFSAWTYLLAAANLDVNNYLVPNQYPEFHPFYDGDPIKNKFGICFNAGVGAQVPIALKSFTITPYALGMFGFGSYPITESNTAVPFNVGARTGCRFGYTFKSEQQLYLALEYNYRYVVNTVSVEDDFTNHLLLKVGFEW